jgi:hypothetical protein
MSELWRAVAYRPSVDCDLYWRGKWRSFAGAEAQARRWRDDHWVTATWIESTSGARVDGGSHCRQVTR